MKTYKIKSKILDNEKWLNGIEIETEIPEQALKDLIKNNPELLTPTPAHKRKYFVPKVLGTYYYIIVDKINGSSYSPNADFDKGNLSTGNCFVTEQDAQDELNRRQALVRIWNNYDDKYSWDIDWEDKEQDKYDIVYSHVLKKFIYSTPTDYIQHSTELPYFKSAEDRNQFVSENEKDLLVVFNIKK